MLINLLNPKLTIFFFAFLPQFVPASDPNATLTMIWLSLVFMAVTFIVFAVYGSFAATMRRQVVSRPRVVAWMRRTFAATYVLLAGRLALEGRSSARSTRSGSSTAWSRRMVTSASSIEGKPASMRVVLNLSDANRSAQDVLGLPHPDEDQRVLTDPAMVSELARRPARRHDRPVCPVVGAGQLLHVAAEPCDSQRAHQLLLRSACQGEPRPLGAAGVRAAVLSTRPSSLGQVAGVAVDRERGRHASRT